MQVTAGWVVNAPVAVSEVIDGELVVINMQQGRYYSGDGLGAFIWQCIEQRVAPAAVEAVIATRYGLQRQQVGNVLQAFFDTLQTEGLIRPAAPGDVLGDTAPAPTVEAYEVPALKVYTDMQDLLLLDPIHDVGDQGWPIKPPDLGT